MSPEEGTKRRRSERREIRRETCRRCYSMIIWYGYDFESTKECNESDPMERLDGERVTSPPCSDQVIK